MTNHFKFNRIINNGSGVLKKVKHIFVVNPVAGERDATESVKSAVSTLGVEYELYCTKGPLDATEFVKTLNGDGQQYRVYACGGDGTFNEVAASAVGSDNISVSVFPCGSGNDYIKYYGKFDDFKDLDSLVNGVDTQVDVMKVNGKYAFNFVHFGFDSACLKTMVKVRRKPIIGGKRAYATGVVTALVSGMKHKCRVTVDGEVLGKDKMLLCTVGNGKYVGGKYKCAPMSDNADGLLEICHVNPVSRANFIRLINAYKSGLHLDDPRFTKYVNYKRGKIVEVESLNGGDIHFSIDGELQFAEKFKIEILPGALRFGVPQKLASKLEIKGEKTVVC